MEKELRDYLTETGDPHLFDNGDAFETYPQVRNIRNISAVEPTEPFIDSLKGGPVVDIKGRLVSEKPGLDMYRLNGTFYIKNTGRDLPVVELYDCGGALIHQLRLNPGQIASLRPNAVKGIYLMLIRGAGNSFSKKLPLW